MFFTPGDRTSYQMSYLSSTLYVAEFNRTVKKPGLSLQRLHLQRSNQKLAFSNLLIPHLKPDTSAIKIRF